MKPIVRNILAAVCGLILGSIVNMGLILVSGKVVPPPAGADVETMDGLRASMPLFQPIHFLFPFLAHAMGTLVGALGATLLAGSRRFAIGMIVGVLFLAGGATNVFMLPSPLWFNVVDLVGAYIPMAWLGATLATRRA